MEQLTIDEMEPMADVARQLDVSPRALLNQIRKGNLPATKIGWQWFIERRHVSRDAEWYRRIKNRPELD